MTKHYFEKPIYTVIVVLILFTKSYGQVNSNKQNIKATEINASSIGQPILTKTQSSSQYGTFLLVVGYKIKTGTFGLELVMKVCINMMETVSLNSLRTRA